MIKDKKAQLSKTPLWIINICVLAVVVLTISMVVNTNINRQLETGNLKAQLLTKRVIYNPNCYAYSNPDLNNQVIVGVVDYEKIDSQNNLETSCFQNGENIGVKAVFQNKDYYYNKDYYDEIAPIAFSENYMEYEENYLVKYVNEDVFGFEIITVSVVGKK
ncbi:hypothetical protein GOV05_03140 [Candidatus Woesearchaeota archaeon]|nr:hypothetical protein [Candidatus Woesearchaeota archaeon]